jgi:hypothetical protein
MPDRKKDKAHSDDVPSHETQTFQQAPGRSPRASLSPDPQDIARARNATGILPATSPPPLRRALRGLLVSACGSTEQESDTDPAVTESIAEAVTTTDGPDQGVDDQAKCEAWKTMMRQQPSGQFADDAELSDAFSTFAGAVDEATASFPPEQATVLEDYSEALLEFAADPSSPDANAAVADMTGPMSELTAEIAAECGEEVVNDI